jgi:hypothetical protein
MELGREGEHGGRHDFGLHGSPVARPGCKSPAPAIPHFLINETAKLTDSLSLRLRC